MRYVWEIYGPHPKICSHHVKVYVCIGTTDQPTICKCGCEPNDFTNKFSWFTAALLFFRISNLKVLKTAITIHISYNVCVCSHTNTFIHIYIQVYKLQPGDQTDERTDRQTLKHIMLNGDFNFMYVEWLFFS